jgi:hypothetical protein
MEVSGQLHDPAALPPGKELPVIRGGVGSKAGLHCGEEKNLASAGNRSADVRPIGCRYAERSIPSPENKLDVL